MIGSPYIVNGKKTLPSGHEFEWLHRTDLLTRSYSVYLMGRMPEDKTLPVLGWCYTLREWMGLMDPVLKGDAHIMLRAKEYEKCRKEGALLY